MICPHCDRETELSTKDLTAREFLSHYQDWIEENREMVEAVSAVITSNVVDNNAGSEFNAYEWPEAEAVVIIRHWGDIARIMGGFK